MRTHTGPLGERVGRGVIVVPLTVIVGGALAWAGYTAFMESSDEPQVDGHAAPEPANGQPAHG